MVKYDKVVYEETEFYGVDEDLLSHEQKVVKVRKNHNCCQCRNEIKAGTNALCETGFLYSEPVRAYTCIDCCDKWLDEIHGEEDEHGERL